MDKFKFIKLVFIFDKYLNEGLVVSLRNVKINVNGEIDVYVWLFFFEFNIVIFRYFRDNSLKRVFGYNLYFWCLFDDIEEGNYLGWKKIDVISEFSLYGVLEGDGIIVYKLERIEKIKEENG